MRLKRLELFGFKSFADRTVLEFEYGLTGIVGPNGCGKSNVVDAIRWSLGEQRPTSMRGGEMVDVIFMGSASRQPLSVAEVTLILDNDSGVLAGRGAEVSIMRRVFKSGEGEYLIDGERVRLKDVRDMLYDTGLGSRGYSVLEQGKIDAVLSANPIERRAIFEEAAGISRYRHRKNEAENKLKRVERDMERLEDVVRELGSRSRSLKIQAGKAERFLAARDGWRMAATSYARHRAFDLGRGLESVRERIETSGVRTRELRELRRGGEGDVHERELERAALTAEVERTTSRSSEVAAELSTLDERKAQLSARVAAWRKAAEEERMRALELERRLAERRAELDVVRTQARSLALEAKDAEERLRWGRSALVEARRSLQEVVLACDAQNERVLELLHEKTGAENEVVGLERGLEPLAERLRRTRERALEARRVHESACEAVERARFEVQRAEEVVADLDRRRALLDGEARALEAHAHELRERKGAGLVERSRLEARIEALLDREVERESLDAGSREVIGLAEWKGRERGEEGEGEDGRERLGGGPAFAEGPRSVGGTDSAEPGTELWGLLADHLRTSTFFARALDAVLGERAQALVVKDDQDAAAILAWLKQGLRGQARLVLPRGLGRARPLELEPILGQPGVVGSLASLAEADPGYEELAEALLGRTVVVSDLERAMDLVARFTGLCCVTAEGDFVDAAGVTGGHREVVHGPVGRRASAAELSAEVENLLRQNDAVAQELGQLEERRGALESHAREVLDALDAARGVLGDARGAAESARARESDTGEAAALLESECGEIERERNANERALDDARAHLAALVAAFEHENERLEELVAERRGVEGGREELSRVETQVQVESTRLSAELEGARRREADVERGCVELEREETRTRELALRHENDAGGGEEQYAEIDRARDERLAERVRVAEHLEELRGRERVARDATEALRTRIDAVTRELETEMNVLSDAQLEEQRLSLARDELLRRAAEELSLTEYDLLAEFVPNVLEGGSLGELELEVAELRRELDRLGSVNLEAVEELEEVSGRLGFLEEQRADVLRARSALQGTLRTINEESERLFLEAFQEICANFERLFRQLFGGGRASIELAPGVPVLEAGIEISARPPGREMLPLGLLSGGQRTMTALALLFAVFQSRPSPFCVLDEVDAALDDANIGRFLVLLDGFTAGTQFIVVTHNKGTMSACQALYGITMETRGVSRQVQVELEQVDAFVPGVSGDADRAQSARREIADAAADVEAEAPLDAELEGDEPVVELVPGGSVARHADGNGAALADHPEPVEEEAFGR